MGNTCTCFEGLFSRVSIPSASEKQTKDFIAPKSCHEQDVLFLDSTHVSGSVIVEEAVVSTPSNASCVSSTAAGTTSEGAWNDPNHFFQFNKYSRIASKVSTLPIPIDRSSGASEDSHW